MRFIILFLCAASMISCGAYLNQPVQVKEARIASKSNLERTLNELPKPSNPIVVAVYKFKDQTGQYKPSEVGSSFSTAVTQGGTNILIKSLDDSGWFKVIERENIGNLLNERKIIRQTRMQYDADSKNNLLVNPLLFAGVIIEGGIVSYDANIRTGGVGVRYFGSGGSTAYRQDRVTVYLRAIATKTGEVLKNVTTSKTILSQSLDGGVFRFVKFSRLLEAETGFTFNEPADIAVTEAVQKAVYSLIVEGVKDGLWAADSSYQTEALEMLTAYDEELSEGALEDYLGVKRLNTPRFLSASVHGTGQLYQGDFPNPKLRGGVGLGLHYELSKSIGFDLGYVWGAIEFGDMQRIPIGMIDIGVRYKPLRNAQKSPYLRLGLGNVFSRTYSQSNLKFNTGIGFDWSISQRVSADIYLDWNQFFTDGFDGFSAGRYVDYFYQFGVGVKYNLPIEKGE